MGIFESLAATAFPDCIARRDRRAHHPDARSCEVAARTGYSFFLTIARKAVHEDSRFR